MSMICVLSVKLTNEEVYKIRYATRCPQFKVHVCYICFNFSLYSTKRRDFDYIQKKVYPKEWIIEYMQAYLKQS